LCNSLEEKLFVSHLGVKAHLSSSYLGLKKQSIIKKANKDAKTLLNRSTYRSILKRLINWLKIRLMLLKKLMNQFYIRKMNL